MHIRTATKKAIAACLFLVVAALTVTAQTTYIIADQFGVKHDITKALTSGTCIIAAGNAMDAPARLVRWTRMLNASALSEVPTFAVCDLSGMPFFVPKAPTIKKLQKEYPDTPILLDWKGELAKRVSLQKSDIVVELFRDGASIARVTGDADAIKLLALTSGR